MKKGLKIVGIRERRNVPPSYFDSMPPREEESMSFKLTYTPERRLPKTWAAVAKMERRWKIQACRSFLRLAAIKLCDVAGLHYDDVVMLFSAIPAWMDLEKHAWKRVQEKDWAWRCNEEWCKYLGCKVEFFRKGKQYAICPKCGRMNAQEVPGTKMIPDVEIRTERDLVVEQDIDRTAAGYVGSDIGPEVLRAVLERGQAKSSDKKASFCACDGQPCPVCSSLGRKNIIIEHHSCIVCETLFCPTCHGIVTAGSGRAFDSCARCKC